MLPAAACCLLLLLSHAAVPCPCLQSHQPGMEVDMQMKPIYIRDSYKGSGKLQGKVAIITGAQCMLRLGQHAAAEQLCGAETLVV
jgi:hypothetical protein